MNVEFISGVRISSAHRLLSIVTIQNLPETKQYIRNLVPNVLKQQTPLKNTNLHLPGAVCFVKIRARVAEFLQLKRTYFIVIFQRNFGIRSKWLEY